MTWLPILNWNCAAVPVSVSSTPLTETGMAVLLFCSSTTVAVN